MPIEQLANIAEVLGMFVVAVTLIFLVVQLRQNTKAIKVASSQEFVETYSTFTSQLAVSESLSEIWLKGLRDFSALTGNDVVRFSAASGQLIRVYESAHTLWRAGAMEEPFFVAFTTAFRDAATAPGFRQWWDTRRNWYSPDFREFADTSMADSGGESLYSQLVEK